MRKLPFRYTQRLLQLDPANTKFYKFLVNSKYIPYRIRMKIVDIRWYFLEKL